MSNYISSINGHKNSIIFLYLQDIVHAYNQCISRSISKEKAITIISRLYHYLCGFLFGLDVKHKRTVIIINDIPYDVLTFYNNSTHSVKYELLINLNIKNFRVIYTVHNKNER